jgi:hypothetical protein
MKFREPTKLHRKSGDVGHPGSWIGKVFALRVLTHPLKPLQLLHLHPSVRTRTSQQPVKPVADLAERAALQAAEKLGFVSGHDFSRAEKCLKYSRALSPGESQHGRSPSLIRRLFVGAILGVAPDFSPGERVFKPAVNAPVYKLRALALVAASQAVCEFFRSLFSP